MVPEGRAVIDGELVDAISGAVYADTSPIDGAKICAVADCQVEDVDAAVAAARRCFEDGALAAREHPRQEGGAPAAR